MDLEILITSPSLKIEENVSGISNLTKLLIDRNKSIKYIHFTAGKSDIKKHNLVWFLDQFRIIFSFCFILSKNKKIRIVHINMPLAFFSIIRDSVFILIAKFFKKKIILHFHGGPYNLKNNLPLVHKWFFRKAISLSNKIIVLSEKEQLFWLNNYSIDKIKVIILPNSVVIPDKILDKTNYETLNILYFGRIHIDKGLREIIKSLKILPNEINYKLLIAGDGPDRDYFLSLCTNELQGKFDYRGVIDGKEKEELMNKSHIFVLPSYYEGLPYALIETMSWKVIPIITNVGSVDEVVVDKKNGFLTEIGDHLKIRNSIINICENQNILKALGDNAHSTIKSRFNLSIFIDSINSMYFKLV